MRKVALAVLAAMAFTQSAAAFDLGNVQDLLKGTLPGQGSGAPATAPSSALAGLSNAEVGSGLKAALTRGAEVAVQQLGRKDGFYGSDKWRIPLPPALQKAESLMRLAGMGSQADQLDLAINRAAEAAVPEAKTLLVQAVKSMTLQDAKGILTGGDEAATQYFQRKTDAPLTSKFLPIVARATDKVGLAQTYNRFAGQAAQFGLIQQDQASIQSYVTKEALKRLYTAIGEEEKAIRADPVGTGSKLISKVFGAVAGR